MSKFDIAHDYQVSNRTAKDYIKTIRNIVSDSDYITEAFVFDRSLKKYVIK